MIQPSRTYLWSALVQVGIATCAIVFCVELFGCEDNVCEKAVAAYVHRSKECNDNDELGEAPDEVECSEMDVDHFECTYQCYLLPCSTPVEAYSECLLGCAR